MASQRKILVVDDEAHILQVLTLKLRNAGYAVVTAVDGEDGYETCCRELPDLLITDYQMPYMSGLQLTLALAREPATRNIPVFLLTARGYSLDPADLDNPNLQSIRQVLAKPFSPRAIVQQVNELLNSETAPAEAVMESPGGAT